jgi:signal peptidase I
VTSVTSPASAGRQARRRWSLVLPVAALGIAVMLPLATLLTTAFLMGWRFQPIETGSMAPRYPAGSLAVVLPIDPAAVEPGSTIVFADPQDASRLVAHRAIRQLPGDPPSWRTRGDANPGEDPFPVPARAIQGHVAWAIPGLGALVMTMRGWPAAVLLVGLPLTLLAMTEWRDRRRRTQPARA